MLLLHLPNLLSRGEKEVNEAKIPHIAAKTLSVSVNWTVTGFVCPVGHQQFSPPPPPPLPTPPCSGILTLKVKVYKVMLKLNEILYFCLDTLLPS